MAKDFYHVLGVSKSASPDEIKAAFRKLAHQHHPDKPGGNAEKFKEINEAYQVLSDKDKRAKYDQFGSAAFDGSAGGYGGGGFGGFQGGFGGFDFSGFQQAGGFEDLGDMFGDMFGFGGGRRSRATQQGSDVQVDVDLSFKDAIFGTKHDVTLTRHLACEVCKGNGAEPGTSLKTCDSCKGKGVKVTAQRTMFGTFEQRRTCDACSGSGSQPSTHCKACRGDGVTKQKKTLTITIPPGTDDGIVFRLQGEGEAVKGGKAGDLFLRMHVKQDKRFVRKDSTLYSEVRIGFTQAALGATVAVDTVDGPVDLQIPAGIQYGTELRLREKGVPTHRGRGDHIVQVIIETPTHLSREQKHALEQLNHRINPS